MLAITRPLPIAPRPRHDELVSSWLGRTAAHYDLDGAALRALIVPDGGNERDRPDIDLDGGEVARLAEVFRLTPERVAGLDLRRAWPDLRDDWLPSIGAGWRTRGELEVSWCRKCLEEGHASGGIYLNREAALPLVLCHRHHIWRFARCQFCRPQEAPRFVWVDGAVDLFCGDCHRLLRNPGRRTWDAGWDNGNRHLVRTFEILLLFEKCLRSAWLGGSVRLQGVGEVAPAEFLSLVADLTCALLAPGKSRPSLINQYDCGLFSVMPRHKTDCWRHPPYHELSPIYRAWVLSAVIAIVSSEETSLLFTGRSGEGHADPRQRTLAGAAARAHAGAPRPLRDRRRGRVRAARGAVEGGGMVEAVAVRVKLTDTSAGAPDPAQAGPGGTVYRKPPTLYHEHARQGKHGGHVHGHAVRARAGAVHGGGRRSDVRTLFTVACRVWVDGAAERSALHG